MLFSHTFINITRRDSTDTFSKYRSGSITLCYTHKYW